MQPFDRLDDHGLGGLPLRGVGRQVAGQLFGMPQPHGDMEPVQKRRRGDAGIDQARAPAGTAVGDGGQPSVVGLADLDKVAPDLRFEGGLGSGDGGEDLPGPIGCLDLAEADFQVPLARLTAADAGSPAAVSRSCSPTRKVRRRTVSELIPASTGSRCSSTPGATR